MPATLIAAYARFSQPGISKCIWAVSVASKSAPTRAEINAGIDLSRQIADFGGWSSTSENIETPDLASKFTSSIGGRQTAEDSTLMLYLAQDGVDVRTTLVRDTNGFIIWMDGGDVAGYKMDVFPVRISSTPKQRSVGDEALRMDVQFNITSEPAENVTIPA